MKRKIKIAKHPRKPRRLVLDNGIYKIPFNAETMSVRDIKRIARWSFNALMWRLWERKK